MKRAPLPPLFGRDVAAVHCAGVGGMGVGPLAIYLAQLGFAVSGEDDAMTEPMRAQLTRAGVALTAAGAVPADCGLVVYSSAIAPEHPAVVAARGRGLPLVRRGELLAEVTREKKLVAVCGSHGKTTTTALLVTVLRAANFPAGYVLGGLFADEAVPPARAGSNDWVVAEVDESDGTIERFAPELTVAVNLDWDHPDHYHRLADLEATFAALFARTSGAVLVSDACALSARVTAQAEHVGTSRSTFGRTGDFSGEIADESAGRMTLRLGGKFSIGTAIVGAQGDFNAANATAALAAAQLMGAEISARSLANFSGVRRRQGVLRAGEGLTVIEDYAHHPAEIRALLGSLRRRANGRLVVVFQPHRFSRTKQFKAEFAASLALGDALYLLDVYGAGETPLAGGTTADLYAELQRAAPTLPVSYLPGDADGVLAALARARKNGDLVAFVGAGDIDLMARRWLDTVAAEEKISEGWDAHAENLRAAVSPATKLRREEPLARKTTMGVGGAARIYAEPADEADLSALVRAARARGVPVAVLGRGSNLVVPDEGVDALVISLRQPAWEIFEPRADGRVWAGAGLRLKQLCGLATKAGLAGFEFLEGIPGNVGGALRMNAGAMGGWMFDVVEEVRVLTFDGEVRVLARAEMHVDYRHCAELHGAIALGALLRPAARGEAAEIGRQLDAYREKRQKSQPREPSAGCIFKNPPGDFAGRLIEASGLKGERMGDAEVSRTHANFIVNQGRATAAEVIALVRHVRARVEQAQRVRLEPEVLLYGKKWEDVL
jgi:UDP-N-acetylmuramate--L-alanine ligase/UDP-N-acetylenolpyruvoylglucosamine reductase